jgi:hypothetical protein
MIYVAIFLCFLVGLPLLYLRSRNVTTVHKKRPKQVKPYLSSTVGCANSAKQDVTQNINLGTKSIQSKCTKQWQKKKGRVTYQYTEVKRSTRLDTDLLCSRCHTVRAKPTCSYKQCGRCCRGNSESVCSAHGMGALVADMMVEKALTFQPLELDLRCCVML